MLRHTSQPCLRLTFRNILTSNLRRVSVYTIVFIAQFGGTARDDSVELPAAVEGAADGVRVVAHAWRQIGEEVEGR